MHDDFVLKLSVTSELRLEAYHMKSFEGLWPGRIKFFLTRNFFVFKFFSIMITPSIACIAVLLLCTSTNSMDADAQSPSAISSTSNSQELPPQLLKEHPAEGTS